MLSPTRRGTIDRACAALADSGIHLSHMLTSFPVVDSLGLLPLTVAGLHNHRISRVLDVLGYTEHGLTCLAGVGAFRAKEVRYAIKRLGLDLLDSATCVETLPGVACERDLVGLAAPGFVVVRRFGIEFPAAANLFWARDLGEAALLDAASAAQRLSSGSAA